MNIKLYIQSDFVTDGYNPENAEPDNPQGYNYKKVFFVEADLNDGELFTHFKAYDLEEDAEKLKEVIAKFIAKGVKLNMERWTFHRYGYGSKAYQRNYREAEGALMDDEERQRKGY